MYHAIVRRKVLSLFEAINRGDAQPVIDGFAEKFEHIFLGETALGGRRTSRAATAEWYARLYRLLPDINFVVHRVTVSGTPWNTLAVAEWTETNSGTDGVRTSARGAHRVGEDDAAAHLPGYGDAGADLEPAGGDGGGRGEGGDD